MCRLRFIEDCLLEVVDHYDEENDDVSTVDEQFRAGEESDGDVVETDDEAKTTTFQFGDGSVAYRVPNRLFVLFEIKHEGKADAYRDYEDHDIEGLLVRGTSDIALVISKGLMSNFELHSEQTTGSGEDAFLKCLRWRRGYLAHLEANKQTVQ